MAFITPSSPPRARRAALAALVAGGAFTCFTATAGAQNYAPAEAPPTFMTLDRVDGTSRFGFQSGFTRYDQIGTIDVTGLRFNLFGQVMLPQRNVGLYGQLALSRAYIDDESSGGISNLEAGAYVLVGGRSDVILRFGAILPTASDDADGLLANGITALERLTDAAMGAPDFTFLRLSLSTLQESGAVFFRADLGVDLAVDTPAGNQDNVYGRANVALGLRTSAIDFMLELANFANVDGDGDFEDRAAHTAAVGLRTRGHNQVHGGMVFALDEGSRGDVWIFSIGFQHAI